MKTSAFHVLRVGLAITFMWIGILIIANPVAWGSYIQPWAQNLLPGSLRSAMLVTGVLDIGIGIFLVFNAYTWIAALFAVLHILVVFTTSGINSGTVRDIGLLAASLAIAMHAWPDRFKFWEKEKKYGSSIPDDSSTF